jgi:hypothetical protein
VKASRPRCAPPGPRSTACSPRPCRLALRKSATCAPRSERRVPGAKPKWAELQFLLRSCPSPAAVSATRAPSGLESCWYVQAFNVPALLQPRVSVGRFARAASVRAAARPVDVPRAGSPHIGRRGGVSQFWTAPQGPSVTCRGRQRRPLSRSGAIAFAEIESRLLPPAWSDRWSGYPLPWAFTRG